MPGETKLSIPYSICSEVIIHNIYIYIFIYLFIYPSYPILSYPILSYPILSIYLLFSIYSQLIFIESMTFSSSTLPPDRSCCHWIGSRWAHRNPTFGLIEYWSSWENSQRKTWPEPSPNTGMCQHPDLSREIQLRPRTWMGKIFLSTQGECLDFLWVSSGQK